jgi:hypothetical protein
MPTHSKSKITQFKKELWIDMSNTCDSRFWTYSTSEKRLFFIFLFFFASLSFYYFNSYHQESRAVKAEIQAYAEYNTNSLKKISAETLQTTPTPPPPKKSFVFAIDSI